jgi:hypothetical protein
VHHQQCTAPVTQGNCVAGVDCSTNHKQQQGTEGRASGHLRAQGYVQGWLRCINCTEGNQI